MNLILSVVILSVLVFMLRVRHVKSKNKQEVGDKFDSRRENEITLCINRSGHPVKNQSWIGKIRLSRLS